MRWYRITEDDCDRQCCNEHAGRNRHGMEENTKLKSDLCKMASTLVASHRSHCTCSFFGISELDQVEGGEKRGTYVYLHLSMPLYWKISCLFFFAFLFVCTFGYLIHVLMLLIPFPSFLRYGFIMCTFMVRVFLNLDGESVVVCFSCSDFFVTEIK